MSSFLNRLAAPFIPRVRPQDFIMDANGYTGQPLDNPATDDPYNDPNQPPDNRGFVPPRITPAQVVQQPPVLQNPMPRQATPPPLATSPDDPGSPQNSSPGIQPFQQRPSQTPDDPSNGMQGNPNDAMIQQIAHNALNPATLPPPRPRGRSRRRCRTRPGARA